MMAKKRQEDIEKWVVSLIQESMDRSDAPDRDRVLKAMRERLEKDPEFRDETLTAYFDEVYNEFKNEQREKK